MDQKKNSKLKRLITYKKTRRLNNPIKSKNNTDTQTKIKYKTSYPQSPSKQQEENNREQQISHINISQHQFFQFLNKKIQTQNSRIDVDKGSILLQHPKNCFFNIQGRHHLPVKGRKERFQLNEPNKNVGVAISISDKIAFKPKLIRRDREGFYIPNKGKSTKKKLQVLISAHQTQGYRSS